MFGLADKKKGFAVRQNPQIDILLKGKVYYFVPVSAATDSL